MFPENIIKCLAVLFLLSTLLGTMQAEDNDKQSSIQEIPPLERVNGNDVQYQTVMEAASKDPLKAWGDWIFDGVVPESSYVPYDSSEQNEYDYDYDSSIPYSESDISL